MDRDIKNIYECASRHGMNPFMFDSEVIKNKIFNDDLSLNIKKYKKEANKILKGYENE